MGHIVEYSGSYRKQRLTATYRQYNCEEQQISGCRAWQDDQAVQAVQEQAVRAKLDELSQSICPYFWLLCMRYLRAGWPRQTRLTS
jgi:hypothetical protein